MSTSSAIADTARHHHTRARRGPAPRTAPGLTTLEIVALIVIVLLLIAGVVLTSGRPHLQTPTSRVFVEKGDTPWTIAVRHPIAGQTTQQTAEQIAEINKLGGGCVPAGRAIVVPATRAGGPVLACR
jgi:hypothetical protein